MRTPSLGYGTYIVLGTVFLFAKLFLLFHSWSMFRINNALSNVTAPSGKTFLSSKKLDVTLETVKGVPRPEKS